jgi:hypothetical protein
MKPPVRYTGERSGDDLEINVCDHFLSIIIGQKSKFCVSTF